MSNDNHDVELAQPEREKGDENGADRKAIIMVRK